MRIEPLRYFGGAISTASCWGAVAWPGGVDLTGRRCWLLRSAGSAAARRATGNRDRREFVLLLLVLVPFCIGSLFLPLTVCVTETTLSATARPCPPRPFASATGAAVPGVGRDAVIRRASRARPVRPGPEQSRCFHALFGLGQLSGVPGPMFGRRMVVEGITPLTLSAALAMTA